jgi:predicted DNA-binding transcriptional regulator AlpA
MVTTGNNYLNSSQVRKRYGGVSKMTLWRWMNDPALQFPKPEKIRSRNYWRSSELEAWRADNSPECVSHRVPDGNEKPVRV